VAEQSNTPSPDDGGDATTLDLQDPQLQEVIKANVDNAVKPLQANNKKLLGQLKAFRDLVTEAGGEDAIRELLASRSQTDADDPDDEAPKPKPKTPPKENAATLAYQRNLDKLQKEIEEAKQSAERERELRYRDTVTTQLLTAASEMYAEDAELVSRMLATEFTIDEENYGRTPVMLNEDGSAVLGLDGRTPKTVRERVMELKESRPFLFKKSSGMGVSTGNGRRMTADQYAKLSPIEKLKMGHRKNAGK